MHITVPSFAKLNLDLRVLDKRPDGYHELRTIFQTISLKDSLSIEFDLAKRTQIDLDCSIDIPDNLVVRSAKLILDHLKVKAWVRFALAKKIPMGAGLGGGSSNAASVLMALPALARKRIALPELVRLAESLGSDVPFFLLGGTALGLGRGSEVYPIPDLPAHPVLVVSTGIHVSTVEAYGALARKPGSALTSPANSLILGEFQTIAWGLNGLTLDRLPVQNDFEKVVFRTHKELAAIARKLQRLGARPALMTGSGSALFGIFASGAEAQSAASHFSPGMAFSARFLPRRRYQTLWRRSLTSAGASYFGP